MRAHDAVGGCHEAHAGTRRRTNFPPGKQAVSTHVAHWPAYSDIPLLPGASSPFCCSGWPPQPAIAQHPQLSSPSASNSCLCDCGTSDLSLSFIWAGLHRKPNREPRQRKREALKPNGKPCSAEASRRMCLNRALDLRLTAVSVVVCRTAGRCRYASEVNIRGASGKADGADDFWNFEQLQREKAMLAEEVARLAQTCQTATSEKSRLAQAVREKDKRIAFLHEEKDMLTQVRSCCSCHPCRPRSFCCSSFS